MGLKEDFKKNLFLFIYVTIRKEYESDYKVDDSIYVSRRI